MARNAKWWWVENDDEVVVFVGPQAKCRSYHRRRTAPDGGELHLIHASKDQPGCNAPVVGEKWGQ